MAVSKFSIIFAASMPEITSRASIAGDVLPVRASATLEDFAADENPCPVTLASLGEAIDSHARDPLQRPRNCTAVWKDISLDPDAPATMPESTGSRAFFVVITFVLWILSGR